MQNSSMENVTFPTVCALIFLLGVAWYHRQPRLYHDIASCEQLLTTTNLSKRAAPNQRLFTAFGIHNSFTATDEAYHKASRNVIETQLHLVNSYEYRLRLTVGASNIIQNYVENHGDSVPLRKLVQVLVFRVVLSMFFPDTPWSTTKDVEHITSKINSLWYHSKVPTKVLAAKFFGYFSTIVKDREELHEKLLDILPGLPPKTPISPTENPLNVLLPAYTGLWKTVLKCFIEIRFRSTPSNLAAYNSLFSTFLQNPDTATWYAPNSSGVSVQRVVAENLRLYPPTRRLYMLQDNAILEAVDIETLHRSGTVWGPSPLEFDPERWHRENLDVVKTREYMPFGARGSSISRCPSRKRGGPRLIAVLVGVLLLEFGEGWEVVGGATGEDDIVAEGPLRSGRDAYEGLRLRKQVHSCC